MQAKFLEPQMRTGPNTVLHLKLWAGLMSAGRVFDYMLGGHTITVNGTSCLPTYPGFNFDGSADYIKVPDHADFDFGTGDFSAHLWIKGAAVAAVQKLIAKESGATDPRWYLVLDAGGKFYFFVDDGTTFDSISTTTFTSVTDSVWHSLCLVFDRDVGALTYVDGTAQGSVDVSFADVNLTLNSTHDVYIGCGWSGAAVQNLFAGEIGDVLIYNKALTAADVLDIHNLTKWRYGR